MKHTEVSSRMIRSVGWEGGKMEVTFRNGTTYAFDDVPHEKALELLNATSVGKHFIKHFRDKGASRA